MDHSCKAVILQLKKKCTIDWHNRKVFYLLYKITCNVAVQLFTFSNIQF